MSLPPKATPLIRPDLRCTEIVNYYWSAPSREATTPIRPLYHCSMGGLTREPLLYSGSTLTIGPPKVKLIEVKKQHYSLILWYPSFYGSVYSSAISINFCCHIFNLTTIRPQYTPKIIVHSKNPQSFIMISYQIRI